MGLTNFHPSDLSFDHIRSKLGKESLEDWELQHLIEEEQEGKDRAAVLSLLRSAKED